MWLLPVLNIVCSIFILGMGILWTRIISRKGQTIVADLEQKYLKLWQEFTNFHALHIKAALDSEKEILENIDSHSKKKITYLMDSYTSHSESLMAMERQADINLRCSGIKYHQELSSIKDNLKKELDDTAAQKVLYFEQALNDSNKELQAILEAMREKLDNFRIQTMDNLSMHVHSAIIRIDTKADDIQKRLLEIFPVDKKSVWMDLTKDGVWSNKG